MNVGAVARPPTGVDSELREVCESAVSDLLDDPVAVLPDQSAKRVRDLQAALPWTTR